MERSIIVLGLVCFGLAVVGLVSGCGINTEDVSGGLSNAVGSSNSDTGPGSGKWNPQTPNNSNKCNAFYQLETELIAETMQLADVHHDMVAFCYDAEGNRIKDSDREICQRPIQDLELVIENHVTDVFTGEDIYNNSCLLQGAVELKMPSDLASMRPGNVEDIEEDPHYWGCLTCTYGIEPHYVFQPVSVEIESH